MSYRIYLQTADGNKFERAKIGSRYSSRYQRRLKLDRRVRQNGIEVKSRMTSRYD